MTAAGYQLSRKRAPPKIERHGKQLLILTESSKDRKAAMEIRQYVFERLNTGGERLNAQEIRNCLYASPFNETLISLARSKALTTAWGIPPKESTEPHKVSRKLEKNSLYSKMADCEIVLRYFALNDLSTFKGGMKRTLDDCMIRNQSLKKSKCDELKAEYTEVFGLASKVFGDGLFRLPHDGNLVGRRSVPLADAVLIAFRGVGHKKAQVIKNSEKIVAATKKALQNPEQYELLVGRGNTKKAIEDRINIMKSVITVSAGV